MVEKIITDKVIKFKVIKNSIMGMWKNPEGVIIFEVGRNKVLISFKNQRKGAQMMANGSWIIRENLLNLRAWSQEKSIYEVNHDFIDFLI
ncbi:hypothetical protein AHAS_Ahas09G0105700 [Arachis hypogaea]